MKPNHVNELKFMCFVAVTMILYLMLLHGYHTEMGERGVLACSDTADYAKIPDKYKALCGKNKPK